MRLEIKSYLHPVKVNIFAYTWQVYLLISLLKYFENLIINQRSKTLYFVEGERLKNLTMSKKKINNLKAFRFH